MKKRYIILSAVFFVLGAACGTGIKVDSLCILEPKSGMCWVDKQQNKGFKIDEMENWYSLNETDLRKVINKLEECKRNQP